MDIAQLEVEAGIAYRIESDAALQGFDAVPESLDRLSSERFQTVDDHPAQGKHEITQRFGRIDIYKKGIVVTLYFRIVETVLDQAGLSHTTGGDQGQVVSVGHFPDQVPAFLFAVAKVFRGLVAAGYEGIFKRSHSWFIVLREDNYYKVIIKRGLHFNDFIDTSV